MNCKEVIEGLKKLPLETALEQDIVNLMQEYGRAGAIITKLHPAYTEDSIPNLFVRASNYDPAQETITNTDRLKYPPLQYNTEYQRASTPCRPMFYAVKHKTNKQPDVMSAIRTCLLETIDDYDELVANKKRVAISLRYNDVTIDLYSIFSWEQFQSSNPEMQDIVSSFKEMVLHNEPEIISNTKLLVEYLAERFSIPVGDDEYNYKPSAVITQYLMDKLYGYGIDGVIFPSTKVEGKELNIAMNPTASDKKLYVSKILDCEYKPGRIVEIQKRGDVIEGTKEIDFNEDVKIEINLNE